MRAYGRTPTLKAGFGLPSNWSKERGTGIWPPDGPGAADSAPSDEVGPGWA
jgi:hypothetical protein